MGLQREREREGWWGGGGGVLHYSLAAAFCGTCSSFCSVVVLEKNDNCLQLHCTSALNCLHCTSALNCLHCTSALNCLHCTSALNFEVIKMCSALKLYELLIVSNVCVAIHC